MMGLAKRETRELGNKLPHTCRRAYLFVLLFFLTSLEAKGAYHELSKYQHVRPMAQQTNRRRATLQLDYPCDWVEQFRGNGQRKIMCMDTIRIQTERFKRGRLFKDER